VSLEKKIEIEKAALDLKKEVLETRVAKKKNDKEYKKLHEEETQKKNNEKENKDDPIITYLSLISSHHNTKLDRQYVESEFDSYSIAPKENKDESSIQTGDSEGESELTIEEE
jgi:hypothetical protein